MISESIVKKYTKALFDVTYEKGTSGQVAKELIEIEKAFISSPAMLEFFNNPFAPVENKLTAVKTALEGKVSAESYNFVLLLAKNSRLGLVQDMATEFSRLVQSSAGITKGKLFAAVDVSEEYLKKAEEAASKALGKKVQLSFEADPTMIAGYKVQVGGWTMDDSAKTHLKILKEDLMKRGL